MGKLIEQFLKFGIVGVIATAIDFVVMIALVATLQMNPVIASGVSFVVSLVFNYLASMRFVFTRRDDLSRQREFVLFVVLSLIGLGINELVMWLGQALFLSQGINYAEGGFYVAVKVIATAVVMLWNFWSRKRWLDAGDAAKKNDAE